MFKPWDPRVKPSAATAASKPGKRLDLSLAAAAACVVVMLTAPLVGANPTGGVVVRGNAAIATQPGRVTVDQRTGKAVINWNGFSIEEGEVTQFNQPGRRSIALNRVITKDPSRINGQLRANGNLWLINQNGVTVGPRGKVRAQGFLATTADIADDNFMRGRYKFDRPSPNPNARVVNQGHISLGERGLGALVAPHARNDGLIEGQGSTVVIAGAETFAVDFYGDDLIHFEAGPVTQRPEGVEALAANHGEIEVDGGRVLLTAAAAEGIVDQAIQVGGKIHARSAYTDGGEIVLDGGDHGTLAVTGILDASSTHRSGHGGKIDIRGRKIRLGRKSLVRASGGDIRIGGDRGGQGPGRNADSVVLAAEARIIADATGFGDGGSIIVYGKETAKIEGQLTARGGPSGGDGGFVETSAAGTIEIAGIRVDASASTPAGKPGTWLIDPRDITIGQSLSETIVNALKIGQNVTIFTSSASTPQAVEGELPPLSPDPGQDGNITVEASIRPDLTTNPNATNQQTVTLTLTADNDVTVNSGITIGPTDADAGDSMGVTIVAGNDIKFLQSPSKIPGTIDVAAGLGGAVSLTAANNVDLGRINAGVGNISITATAGAITDNTAPPSVGDDGGAGDENLVGGAINLTAGTGIGGATVGDDIDIAATSLNATITGSSGGIFIAETDDLALGHIKAAVDPDTGAGVGDIVLTAGGAITDQDTTAVGEGAGNENLVGGIINLTAGGSIGTSGDGAIDTAVATKLDA